MERRIIFIAVLLLNSLIILAQEITIEGFVYDNQTSKPIPYASVGIKNKPYGSIANQMGYFKFIVPDSITKYDAVITNIGYIPVIVPLSDFIKSPKQKINLIPNVQQLPAVIVKPQKFKEKVIGRESHGGFTFMNFFSVHDRNQELDKLGREIGTTFKLKPCTLLESLRFYVNGNDFSEVKFRLNIYSVKDNLPFEVLQKSDIFFSVSNKKRGWVEVDLKSYDLYFEDNKEIAVALQWIESSSVAENKNNNNRSNKGMFFSIPAAINPLTSGVLCRDKSLDLWKKYNANPSINITVKYPVN